MFSQPVQFRTLEKCTVRMGPEKSDAKVGEFPKGAVIEVVLQTKNSLGIEVFQTITAPKNAKTRAANGGWVKSRNASNNKLLLERVVVGLNPEAIGEPEITEEVTEGDAGKYPAGRSAEYVGLTLQQIKDKAAA